MKWLKVLLQKRKEENGVEYVKTLIENMLREDKLYTNEILFRDTIDEVHRQLRKLAIKEGDKNLIEAYEKSVVLKHLSNKNRIDEKQLLEDILKLIH